MIDIQNDAQLAQFCQTLSDHDRLALDTEFIREKTYYPILALIQVAVPGGPPTLIDPLTIEDWSPFYQVLRNPNIRKIFHAGRQDLEIMNNIMGELPANYFDTQIAAAMCGYGEQVGYAGLVAQLNGVNLPKDNSYSNWLERPLSQAQIEYARNDVRYLLEVYDHLVAEAESKGRRQWIEEEVKEQLPASLFSEDNDNLWRKVKKAGTLRPRAQAVLRELAKWRQEEAQKMDKPVRFIVSDEVLIRLAKTENMSLAWLESFRGLSKGFINRHGETLVALHKKARSLPRSAYPLQDQSGSNLHPASQVLADFAWVVIQKIAKDAAMAPSTIVLKRDLPVVADALIRGREASHFALMHGWRKEMAGNVVARILSGELAVKVSDKNLMWFNHP